MTRIEEKLRHSVIRALLGLSACAMVALVCGTRCGPSTAFTKTARPATSTPTAFRVAATLTPVSTMVAASTPISMPANPDRRALWVWNAGVVTDNEAKARFFDFIRSQHVSVIYLHAYDLLSLSPTALADFIAESGGAEVELLAGDPSWALTANHSAVLDSVQDAADFTQGAGRAGPPVGLHFDIEPYLLDEWGSDRTGTITQYLDLLVAIKEKLIETGSPLLLSADIPFWYDTIEATYSGETKPLHQHVQDIVDYIVIMDYRDTAGGDDGIIVHAQNELAYADKINKLVTVGVETNCIDPPKITFCQEGSEVMEQELSVAKLTFKAHASFHGFAIHDYVGYARLSQPLLSPPPSAATSQPTGAPVTPIPTSTDMPVSSAPCPRMSVGRRSPHMIVQDVSYSVNGGPSQITSSEAVLVLRPGNTISIVDLRYCSDVAGGSWDRIQVEAYLRKNGAFDYGDGHFTTGAPVLAGEHSIGDFGDGWTIQAGWDRLVFALVHYYQGGHEVDDRFFLNLVAE